MSLPPKSGPQEWEDVPLPLDLFADTPPKPKRQRSKKDEDDDKTRLTYRPYRGRARMCEDCYAEVNAQKRDTFGAVAFIRVEGLSERAICYEHKAQRVEAEALGRA